MDEIGVERGERAGHPRRLHAADGPRPRTTLALIAHDAIKEDLILLVRAHRQMLAGLRLIATGKTGRLLARELGLPVEQMESGPLGGDPQIGARIVEGGVDAVVFLRDPLTAHPQEPDTQALLKVCDIHGIPVATNLASVEIVLHFLIDRAARIGSGGTGVADGIGPSTRT